MKVSGMRVCIGVVLLLCAAPHLAAQSLAGESDARRFADFWDRPVSFNAFRAAFSASGAWEQYLQALGPREWARLGEGTLTAREIFDAHARRRTNVPLMPSTGADTIVVGSGLSGLTAAQQLRAAGRSVIVVEAADGPGGRIETLREGFSTGVDFGAVALHHSNTNVLVPVARRLGLTLVSDKEGRRYLYDGESLSEENARRLEKAVEVINARLAAGSLGKGGEDAAFWEMAKPRGRWGEMAARYIEQSLMSAPENVRSQEFSARDYILHVEEHPDLFVKEGMNSLVDYFKLGLRIDVNQAVTDIIPDRDGVTVKTAGQVYRAKSVIVTAAPALLTSIRLDTSKLDAPEAERWEQGWSRKLDAARHTQGVPYTKVMLEFDPAFRFPDLPPGSRIHDVSDPQRAMDFYMRLYGRNIAMVMAGGQLADELAKMSERRAVEMVRNRLLEMYRRTYGAPVADAMKAAFRFGARTEWANRPWIRFAWYAAMPGYHSRRKVLAEPIEGRLFFGGEATVSRQWQSTVAGAYLSGQRTSREVLGAVKSSGTARSMVRGQATFAAGYAMKGLAEAAWRRDPEQARQALAGMVTPEFGATLGVFTGAQFATDRMTGRLGLKGARASAIRVTVPAFGAMAAIDVMTGRHDPRAVAIEGAAMTGVGLGMMKLSPLLSAALPVARSTPAGRVAAFALEASLAAATLGAYEQTASRLDGLFRSAIPGN